MKVSVIIPALNEEKTIRKTIGQFRALKGRITHEIVVSDGGSNDNTIDIAKTYGAKIVHNKIPHTIAHARNTGAKASSGEILFFCDADTFLDNPITFINEAIDTFKDTSIVGGVPKLMVDRTQQI